MHTAVRTLTSVTFSQSFSIMGLISGECPTKSSRVRSLDVTFQATDATISAFEEKALPMKRPWRIGRISRKRK